MIAFDLICEYDHVFEAWFGSSQDYEHQKQTGLLSCPFCESKNISKAIMAPNIGRKSNQTDASVVRSDLARSAEGDDNSENTSADISPDVNSADGKDASSAESRVITGAEKQFTEMMVKVQTHIEKNFEYVGKDFPEEARKIHHGEAQERGIYGEANKEQTQELLEEGIDLLPVPLPIRPPKSDA